MSIKEVMKIGTDGMNESELVAEQERRIEVGRKVTEIGTKINDVKACREIEKEGSPARKMYDKQLRKLTKALSQIKADERVWMKEAAYFLY